MDTTQIPTGWSVEARYSADGAWLVATRTDGMSIESERVSLIENVATFTTAWQEQENLLIRLMKNYEDNLKSIGPMTPTPHSREPGRPSTIQAPPTQPTV